MSFYDAAIVTHDLNLLLPGTVLKGLMYFLCHEYILDAFLFQNSHIKENCPKKNNALKLNYFKLTELSRS